MTFNKYCRVCGTFLVYEENFEGICTECVDKQKVPSVNLDPSYEFEEDIQTILSNFAGEEDA